MELKEYEITVRFKVATYHDYQPNELFGAFRNPIDKAVRETASYNNVITSNYEFTAQGKK